MSWGWRDYVVWMLLVLAALMIITHQAGYVESCIEEERIALLDLISYFTSHFDPKINAPYFGGIGEGEEDIYNCCTWERVKCDPTDQHVVQLQLFQLLGMDQKPWVFNVTMLQPFTQLISLDLSENSIAGLVEKQGLCELNSLSELYLTSNNLSHGLPSCLQNLSSLQVIDLSYNHMNGKFQDTVPFHPASLRYLDLSNNNLTGELPPNIFRNLTSLEHLDLSNNHFERKLSLSSFANLLKLQFLDLSRNHLQVDTEDSSWRPSFQLQHLGLQGCSLNKPDGSVPKFLSQQNNLSYINLSNNNLVGSFPLLLLDNSSMPMPRGLEFENVDNLDTLPSYSRHSLHILIISGNNFRGELPENIGFIFPELNILNVSGCHLQGSVPTSITRMSQLEVLDLSFNNFSGELPRQFWNDCTGLEVLILNDNNLRGEIIPDHFYFPSLLILKLNNNRFGGTIKDALRNCSFLLVFDISNNKVTGSLPSWIGNFSLVLLTISKNVMQGQIPKEICNLQNMRYLDLSHNLFTGSIPSCSNFSSLSFMFLNHNNLTGALPSALSSSSSLIALDLRHNELSGGIPLWINKISRLQVLLLGGNNFHGHIPHELCELQDIDMLDISNNQLSGRIPTCFANMSFGFKTNILFSIPSSVVIGDDDSDPLSVNVAEEVELLVKNQYRSYVGRVLQLMSVLDLSSNKFSDVIPPELGNLPHVNTLNLSHNCLSGSIPSNLSYLKQIESLDLSYNHLSSIIPIQLAELSFLETFNVSYNNLTGRTPEAGQFRTFDERSYFGNPGLCVTLVNKSCNPLPPNAPPPSVSSTSEEVGDDDDEGGGLDMEDFLWSFGVTSFIAFMATIAVLGINPQWREALFDFVEWHLLWWLL